MKALSSYKQLLVLIIISTLFACESSHSPTRHSSLIKPEDVTYEKQGLKITHPGNWTLVNDQPGEVADRLVSFRTNNSSNVSVLFYKTFAMSYAELANQAVKQFNLEAGKDVENYQRDIVALGKYSGVRLQWKDSGERERSNELIILQVQHTPFAVFAQFQLFDDDIGKMQTKLNPFVEGINFDPQSI